MAFRKSQRKVFDKTVLNFFLRLFTMLFAQALIALAIGLSRATGLGTSTISCIPAVLSYLSPVTIGTWTLGMNLIFVVVQIVLLRRYFKPVQLLSIPLVAVFSAMIDFFVPLCELIPMSNYAASLAVSVLSCLVMALGGWIQAKCALIMVPGDGVVPAMSVAFRAVFHLQDGARLNAYGDRRGFVACHDGRSFRRARGHDFDAFRCCPKAGRGLCVRALSPPTSACPSCGRSCAG